MKEIKNPIRIDRDNGNIIVSKPYLAKANIVGTKEFLALEEVRAAYPNYDVVARSIRKNPNQNRRHLKISYPYMEKYISLHEKAEERMKEYREMRLRAECQVSSFSDVKKWFVACYSEIDDFTPEDFERECENADGGEPQNKGFGDLLAVGM